MAVSLKESLALVQSVCLLQGGLLSLWCWTVSRVKEWTEVSTCTCRKETNLTGWWSTQTSTAILQRYQLRLCVQKSFIQSWVSCSYSRRGGGVFTCLCPGATMSDNPSLGGGCSGVCLLLFGLCWYYYVVQYEGAAGLSSGPPAVYCLFPDSVQKTCWAPLSPYITVSASICAQRRGGGALTGQHGGHGGTDTAARRQILNWKQVWWNIICARETFFY